MCLCAFSGLSWQGAFVAKRSSNLNQASPAKRTESAKRRVDFECVSLLLQGGGALGAYQGGVYQALAEADLHPDWVAGISIGAINAALIAGNAPEQRVAKLRAFWEGITAGSRLG